MARILAIDYGAKRTGIAVTDPLQIIATGLTTVATPELLDFLQNYLAIETVEKIVVGEPKHLDGTPTDIALRIEKLKAKLKELFPHIEVVSQDERFTSAEAKSIILTSGVKKKKRRDKALVDKISAVLILQDYLGHR